MTDGRFKLDHWTLRSPPVPFAARVMFALAFGAAAWRAWLKKNHATAQEAWVLHSKKNATWKTLTYEEALDEALCFGWIDSVLHTVDDEKFALRYSPRKPKSVSERRSQVKLK